MSDRDCPFCRKLADLDQLLGGELVWRFPHSIALLGTWQYYQGYCVLVSRSHARELFALPDDERRGYLDEMCLLAKAIDSAFTPRKMNYELLGNQVPHLHWHLFPRYADDPARLSPVWVAIDGAEQDEGRKKALEADSAGRSATAARLREVLADLGAPSS